MNTKLLLDIIQIVLAVILGTLILIQARGTGLSGSFGGGYRSKRGFEKTAFVLTIVVAILFVVNSLLVLKFSIL